MRVLVLGASGMAGHVVTLYLRQHGHSVDTVAAKNKLDEATHLLDVADTPVFNNFLDANKYDVIVNCVALLVKPSEERKDLAVLLNSHLPHFLETYYQDTPTRIIHISTDGVFSGKNAPYREDSLRDGESFYGRSKALGEINNIKDLTFRLSIIGPDLQTDGPGLLNWFINQTGELSGYTNSLWSGITTLELAKAINAALEQNVTGIYHLAAQSSISKFDLLQLLKGVFERQDISIKPVKGQASNMSLTNTRNDFKFQLPAYKTMVKDMKDWMDGHAGLYKHYEK